MLDIKQETWDREMGLEAMASSCLWGGEFRVILYGAAERGGRVWYRGCLDRPLASLWVGLRGKGLGKKNIGRPVQGNTWLGFKSSEHLEKTRRRDIYWGHDGIL